MLGIILKAKIHRIIIAEINLHDLRRITIDDHFTPETGI